MTITINKRETGLQQQIIINIDKSADARGMDTAQEVIQRDAMLNFFRHLSESMDKAKAYREFLMSGDMNDRLREHDTITVSGGRGTGKTTFILSMFKLLRTPEQLKLIPTARGMSPLDIEELGILDPTLIEEKEHVFIHLLAKIKKKVDRAYQYGADHRELRRSRQDDCSFNENDPCSTMFDPCGRRPISDECYRDWLKLLKCLAAGLPSLDGVGGGALHNSEKWHDPVYVLEKGLQNTMASNDLEIMFHRFVDKSLKLLNRTAFIIALDDIDTHFKRGWPVLEVLRKYLTTPQLITVLSGDLELYSILVRGEQWKNFDKDMMKYEEKRMPYFHGVVDKLEQQYLLKLLKSERRLELRSLFYLYERSRTSNKAYDKEFLVKVNLIEGSEESSDLSIILSHIVQKLFSVTGSDVKLYKEHLSRETIRTLIRIVFVYLRGQIFIDDKIRIVEMRPLLDVLIDIYSVDLHQKGFDLHFLSDPDPRTALNRLVVCLVNSRLLRNGYRLKADFDDTELNHLMMCLGAVYNKLLNNNPRLFFDYIVKVGLTREISLLKEYDDRQEHLLRYINWSGLIDGDNAVTIARHFTGYVRSLTESIDATTYRGTVSLLRPRRKQNESIKNYTNTIENLYGTEFKGEDLFENLWEKVRNSEIHPLHGFLKAVSLGRQQLDHNQDYRAYYTNAAEELEERVSTWHWRLFNFGLKRAVNKVNENSVYWSFHSFLAVIGELVTCNDNNELKQVIIKYSQVRDFPLPDFGGELDTNRFESGDDDVNIHDQALESIPENVVDGIIEWNKKYIEMLPVHVIAKIFTRFFYSLARVDNDLQIAAKSLGSLIHRYVAIFLNAVLVEEVLYRSLNVSINLNNPTGTDRILLNNIAKIETNRSSLKFFNWLFDCPLWHYFIKPGSQLHQMLTLQETFMDSVYYLKSIKFENLYYLLNSVQVRDYKYKQTDTNVEINVSKSEEERSLHSKMSDNLKRYSNAERDRILVTNKLELRKQLNMVKHDSERMTDEFISQYLEGNYSHLQKKGSDWYKGLQKRLITFMNEK